MREKSVLLVLVTMPLAIVLFIASCLTIGQAQMPNQAGLVVRFGDGPLITRCVEFDEPEINSYDLLLRSGLTIVSAGDPTVGTAICSIEEEGCPVSDCFCQCKGSTCTYWSYWHLVDGAWQYSSMGVSGHMAAPGDVEGWRWGEAEPPRVVPFEEICVPPATDTPEPTPTWTSSPTPNPTETPSPSPEPMATWTPYPSPVPPTDTPLPTETPPPTDTPNPTTTEVPPAASTAGLPDTLGSTPTAALAAGASGEPQTTPVLMPGFSGQAQPKPTQTGTPEPPPTSPPPTPTQTVQRSATPTQVSPATASPTAQIRPTDTPPPTQVALAPDPDSSVDSGTDTLGHETGAAGSNKNLLTILSVGVGMAYIFFVLFVVTLAGLFVLVRLRQR